MLGAPIPHVQISTGHHGRESLKGEFESVSAIRKITQDFVPEPIAWGTYHSQPDTHFYLCEFRDLVADELPEPRAFCEKLAALHKNGVSPNGKFGFHVVTYNGNLPQENGFTDTWEEFFVNGLKHMLRLNLEAGGPSQELEDLMPPMFDKVIPRLLRPLEIGGNSVVPSLVHGDLWCGNAALTSEDEAPLIFDPSCFWAHNECKASRSFKLYVVNTDRRLQMNWEIGVQSVINSQGVTSLPTTPIYPKPRQRRIMMIVTLFMPCK